MARHLDQSERERRKEMRGMSEAVKEAREIINRKDKQIALIIRIAKYQFRWGRKTIFKFAMKHTNELAERLPDEVKKNYVTTRLFAAMSRAEKSHLIQVLEQIERRNELCKKAM